MLIQVLYSDGRYDMVKGVVLDRLIASNEIIQFKRGDGWVDLGRDPVRGNRLSAHRGEDRRRQESSFWATD